MKRGRPIVAALVATCDRSELLAERCLPSILGQSLLPDLLLVVDDSRAPNRSANRAVVEACGARAVYLENSRTPGASGAWNMGLAWLHAHTDDPTSVFVAILDDDDRWAPNHLESCLDDAMQRDLDLVISGIVRHETSFDEGRRQTIPSSLDEAALLIGNPHVQASNLFARLRMLLEAGLFDEDLPSTTDRDLCLRILDLGNVRVGFSELHTAHHHAESDRERLSAPGTRQKHIGLDRFWRKYVGRMNLVQQKAALTRAERLFGWHPSPGQAPPATMDMPSEVRPKAECVPIALVVGIVVDPERIESAERLLADVHGLSEDGLAGLDVVLVENGPRADGTSSAFRALVERKRREGLRIHAVEIEQQREDAQSGLFGEPWARGEDRVDIARGRTIVQRYVHFVARRRTGAIAWILDDDKGLLFDDVGRDGRRLANVLLELRAAGVCVALGQDVDAPPIPAASSIRVQLVDLLHNIRWISSLSPDEPLPDRGIENEDSLFRLPDYFHDLSQATAHLESPFWLTPAYRGETASAALERLAERLPRILAGEQIFRPVRPGGTDISPSIHRGGSTFVLDLDALLVPNASVDLGAGPLRRSDMLWALENRLDGRSVARVPLWVRHDRAGQRATQLDLDTLARDIQGHALYVTLAESLEAEARDQREPFDQQERFHHHLKERLLKLDLSAHRIRGLGRSILRLLSSRMHSDVWERHPAWARCTTRIAAVVKGIAEQFHPAAVGALLRRVSAIDEGALRAFFLLRSRRLERVGGAEPAFLAEQRAENARFQVERLLGVSRPRLLGVGAEGVVFTDERHVFKYFDYWKARDPEQRSFLRTLVGQWPEARSLYPLLRLVEEGCHAILVYPFEPGTLYQGGHGPELVRLLRECRKLGIVCRNIHPKNLLTTRDSVRLIDYGSDIRPFSESGFEQMCRRAWLTFRYHHRPDLDLLCRAALERDDLPELDGLTSFRRAVDSEPADVGLDAILFESCIGFGARRILDHGCGKGKLAERLAKEGLDVVAYDPDPVAQARWPRAPSPGLHFSIDTAALRAGPSFDTIVSSLVLCTLDEVEYVKVLAELRQLVSEDGHVLIAVCNPFFTRGGPTPLQKRDVPQEANEDEVFVWHKVVASTARLRRDVHRPWAKLRRDFVRAGFRIESVRMTETVDLARFEPSSDFLVVTLRPVPKRDESVSLLIRACSMEWQTIEEQVRHIVEQLEVPRAFGERIVVLDVKTDGFARQYAVGDIEAMRLALERLVRAGTIDGFVEIPSDSQRIAELHRRWFGLDVPASHTAAGAPVAATVFGLEVCRSDHVLLVDSDVLIGRLDRSHDHLSEMLDVFVRDPEAIAVSLNICQTEDRPYTHEGPTGPFRVESRAGLVHRARLLAALPLPNERRGEELLLSWHRSMDRLIAAGPWRSYRGGDRRTFFIHPPNDRKRDIDEWMAVLDRVEAGAIPVDQAGHVDLMGSLPRWLGPKRTERFVFVVTGRNVPPGRFLRCLQSMRNQREPWGAVIVDDASRPSLGEFVTLSLSDLGHRVTLLRPRRRRWQTANLVWAIRHVCTDPETVIVTLDADDTLLGDRVLARVAAEYEKGADVTVGSMLRTDKHRTYPVDLRNPRGSRGGNVWQHLRTFRKRLFDAIPDDALRLDGEYVDLANDWAYMIPIVEHAAHPVHIPDPLYLHEPSGAQKGEMRVAREAIIERLLSPVRREK